MINIRKIPRRYNLGQFFYIQKNDLGCLHASNYKKNISFTYPSMFGDLNFKHLSYRSQGNLKRKKIGTPFRKSFLIVTQDLYLQKLTNKTRFPRTEMHHFTLN